MRAHLEPEVFASPGRDLIKHDIAGDDPGALAVPSVNQSQLSKLAVSLRTSRFHPTIRWVAKKSKP